MSLENAGETEEGNGRVRLNRYCARCGLGSRRSCDTLIAAGRIFVNGSRVTQLGLTIDPRADKVEYEGNIVSPARPNAYLAYHKPRGVIVTAFDPQGRETVYDALAKAGVDAGGMRYIGRLDYNSEGLLLLTNDGDLVHALTHPRYHVKKVYEVCVTPVLTLADARKMTDEGIVSEEQLLRAGAVRALQVRTAEGHWYSVDLYEGKKRQLRRIFEALGYTVMRLKRVQFASVKLGDLADGKARPLSEREIAALLSAGHSPPPRK